MEKEYAAGDFSLRYQIERDKVRITGFSGLAGHINVPDQIEGLPVVYIGKKAFLSKKRLQVVELPATVESIEDWAFAYCNGLERITLPSDAVHFGRAVFLDCGRLNRIDGCGPEAWPTEIGYLLAAAVRELEAEYLLDPVSVGSAEWLGKWDARLGAVMREADTEGFSRQILCGEEDYGSTDLEAYRSGRRKRKVRLCMLRLLYAQSLAPDLRMELEGYLTAHTKGGVSEETWQVLLQEYGEEAAYVRLFLELGCVTADNVDGILTDIGDAHPELTAAILRYQDEEIGRMDFFGKLDL